MRVADELEHLAAARTKRGGQDLEHVIEQFDDDGARRRSLIGVKPRMSAYQITARSLSTEPRMIEPAWTRRPASSPR